jgi:Fur family transcriptional regulator, ferric uptake regulator
VSSLIGDISDVHDQVATRLRAADLIYTSGRRQLVELLAELGRPATMMDLLEARPKLTQSSLYRNMGDLEAAGVVQRIAATDDRARFELAEELIGHHHHLICVACGYVDDFVVSPQAERALETALEKAIKESGFAADSHRLDILGRCRNCV